MPPKISGGSERGSPVVTFLWILAIVLVLVILIALFGGCIRCRPSEAPAAELYTSVAMPTGNTSNVTKVAPMLVTPELKSANVTVTGASAVMQSARSPSDVEPVDFEGGPGLLTMAAGYGSNR